MFSWKGRVDITPNDPVFYVRYVGFQQTFRASGRGCTRQPSQYLWDQAPEEKKLKRIALTISQTGIYMKDIDDRKAEVIKHDIKDISYCSADKEGCPRLFCWITKSNEKNRLECHVVLCSTTEKAQAIALVLSRAFHVAYKEWKQMKQRLQRLEGTRRRAYSENSPAPSPKPPRTGNPGDVSSMVALCHAQEGDVSVVNGMANVKEGRPYSFGETSGILDQEEETSCALNKEVVSLMKGDTTASQLAGVAEVSSQQDGGACEASG